MKTSLRLLAMLIAVVGLFAPSWYFFVRERPQPAVPLQSEAIQELLIGTWECVEQDPPPPSGISKSECEITKDGRAVIILTYPGQEPRYLLSSVYQLQGDTIRFEHPEHDGLPATTWLAKIETITDDTLILVGIGENTGLRRVVWRRGKKP